MSGGLVAPVYLLCPPRHYATYASAVHGFSPAGRKLLSSTRKQLYGSLPKIIPFAKTRGLPLGIPKRKKVINGLFTYDDETQRYLLVRLNVLVP